MAWQLPTKGELRLACRRQRQMIPYGTKVCQENLICQSIVNLPQWQSARHIFAYLATAEEPNLAQLWQNFPHKRWAFPRCAWSSRTLAWHIVDPHHLERQTETDRYGIPCPKSDLPTIGIACADLVLVPTLACDRKGYRLGYGGGFYDRSLQDYHGYTVGVVWHQCLLEQLPHDPWDIQLKAVVSDRETLFFDRDFQGEGKHLPPSRAV